MPVVRIALVLGVLSLPAALVPSCRKAPVTAPQPAAQAERQEHLTLESVAMEEAVEPVGQGAEPLLVAACLHEGISRR